MILFTIAVKINIYIVVRVKSGENNVGGSGEFEVGSLEKNHGATEGKEEHGGRY